jgi:hypothetical protein
MIHTRWAVVAISALVLGACADARDVLAPSELLEAGLNRKPTKTTEPSAELIQYWRSNEELWVYDKRPELGMGVHPPIRALDVTQLKAANLRTVRVSLWWGWWNDEQRAVWDEMVPRLQRDGIEIIALVAANPPQYSFANRHEGYRAYADFVGELAARYPSVRYWELWNEMDMGWTDLFGAHDPNIPMLERGRMYAEMLKLAYPAIKRANPNAWVLTGGMMDTNDFPRGIYEGGGRDFFDFMAIHTYGDWVLGEPFFRIHNVHNVMKSYGDEFKPIVNTEFGMSGGITACSQGFPHSWIPPKDDATVFDQEQLKNWRDPIQYNHSERLYWKLFPYQLKAPNDICKETMDVDAKLPAGHVGDDYGFGIFRVDGTTPRPAYNWMKDRDVNGSVTSPGSTLYDVVIQAPEGNLKPIGYSFTVKRNTGEMTIRGVPVNSLVPTVIRFQK